MPPHHRRLVRFGRWCVGFSASRMPVRSPGLCAGLSAFFLLTGRVLAPELEPCARASPLIAAALGPSPAAWFRLRTAGWAMAAGAYGCAWIFQARCVQLCWPEWFETEPRTRAARPRRWPRPFRRKRHGFSVAGMPVGIDDLKTSILVTGVTGSSKTAGVLLPAAEQLLAAYNEDGPDGASASDFQKLGAFVPEVKGDLVDAFIYLAHEAGRCVSRDVLILSPSGRIPVARYSDERGRSWFLAGRGGAGGSEAGEFLPHVVFPSGHPCAGRKAPADVLERPAEFLAVRSLLAATAIPLAGRRPRFVGWRWQGGRLRRVSHTDESRCAVPMPARVGACVDADPPGTLTLDDVVYVDNAVRYNLVDARLPPAEAAERLVKLAAMARGTGPKGDNEYFYEQARKVIAACISLHRAVDATPCTVADVLRLATREDRLEAALAALEEKRARLEAAEPALSGEGAGAETLRREAGPLADLASFFRDDWGKMVADGKTANIVKSVISGTFGPFLQDPNLAETFCSPSTFSFEDLIQSGRIVGLVPGADYEQFGRLLGTACKMDFQSTMLARNGRKDLNPGRLVLYFADECHKYATSGSAAAGDPYFMNLSRSNNVVNVCATQSYAWIVEVLGREAANVYISAFGVQFWLQQTDPETCRRAAEICGLVTRERVGSEGEIDAEGLAGALRSGRGPVVRRRVHEEERPRFRPEDFALLDVGEVVAYNKGRPGRSAKVTAGRVAYPFCTSRPEGAAAVAARVREYYREVLENLAHERGETARWDSERRTA